MTERQKGILAMVLACLLWGTAPLYYKLLTEVPPLEVLAHRTLWSAVIFLGLLLAGGRMGALRPLLRGRRLGMVALAAGLISFNWFLFIFSVQAGHVIEAALGYYIFPLVSVALGMLAFGERLTPGQGVAVALAAFAVVVLTWGLGVAPWIALTIACSFGLYGLLKKRLAAPPVPSVTAEVLVLVPLALVWLTGIAAGYGPGPAPGHFFDSAQTAGLLVLSGGLTASPLILFTYATARVRLATVGLIQYINPTLQFLTATLIFAEPFGQWHAIAFTLIWAGLALYSLEGFRQDRAARRAAVSAGTSATAAK